MPCRFSLSYYLVLIPVYLCLCAEAIPVQRRLEIYIYIPQYCGGRVRLSLVVSDSKMRVETVVHVCYTHVAGIKFARTHICTYISDILIIGSLGIFVSQDGSGISAHSYIYIYMRMYRLSGMHLRGHVSSQHYAVYDQWAPTHKLMQRSLIVTSEIR